jgi:hypothetical protein
VTLLYADPGTGAVSAEPRRGWIIHTEIVGSPCEVRLGAPCAIHGPHIIDRCRIIIDYVLTRELRMMLAAVGVDDTIPVGYVRPSMPTLVQYLRLPLLRRTLARYQRLPAADRVARACAARLMSDSLSPLAVWRAATAAAMLITLPDCDTCDHTTAVVNSLARRAKAAFSGYANTMHLLDAADALAEASNDHAAWAAARMLELLRRRNERVDAAP